MTLAQTPSADPLGIVKNLPADTHNSLIPSGLGKGDGAGIKADPKLNSPETARAPGCY